MRTRTLGPGLALVVLIALAACGGGSSTAATTTTTTEPTSTTTLPVMPSTFDWWAPTATPIGHGWTIEALPAGPGAGEQGPAPLPAGRRPPPGLPRALPLPGADRPRPHPPRRPVRGGLPEGPHVRLRPAVPGGGRTGRPETVRDGTAVRYGFTGGAASAADSERTVQWAGVRGSALVIVTISGYDPGSCLPNTGQGSLDDLKDIIPGLDALIRASGLPRGQAGLITPSDTRSGWRRCPRRRRARPPPPATWP